MSQGREHRRRRPPTPDKRDALLLRLVDFGLAGVVFLLPFCMGGRQALGQFLLIVLASFVTAAWMARQALRHEASWRHSPAQWLLLAAVLLIAVQIVPLPESWLLRLSPELGELLPLWNTDAGKMQLDQWSHLSLMPEATREGLVQWMAYAALFLVAVQRIAGLADVQRLLTWVAWSSVAMAAFGLIQYLASNGKFFWIYQHPFVNTADCVRGAFTNRNHFAHFLALGLGPLAWWVQRTVRREDTLRAGLAVLMLAIVLFAALMSFSRGGAVAILAAACVYLAISWRASLLSGKTILACAALGLLVGASLLVHGYQSVAGRLTGLASGSLEQLDPLEGRRKVWNAVSEAIADFPLLGTGVGTHREIYHRYLDGYTATEYTHAENGYLQVTEETGLLGLSLLVIGVGLCATWCIRTLVDRQSQQMWPCLAAVAASLTASAVHAVFDFVWYVPSCAVLVALLAACAFHLRKIDPRGVSQTAVYPLPRLAWGGACGVVLLAGVFAAAGRFGSVLAEPHVDRYLIAHCGVTDPQRAADLMLGCMSAAVAKDPGDARTQLTLAEACLRQFDLAQQQSDNPMSLAAVRDAAIAGGFRSRPELMAWLDRALGPRRQWLDRALWHTRAALALCPLQAQGYLYLAELSFLEQTDPGRAAALIDQALAVRPHDGGVHFKAGEEAALAGDPARAIKHWKQAFHAGPALQGQLIDYLVKRGLPPSFFLQELAPDRPALHLLYLRFHGQAPPEEFQPLAREYLSATAADGLWLEAHRLAAELSDHGLASQYAQQALTTGENDFQVRSTVGHYLLARGRFAEAETHLKWCVSRKPDDKPLAASLAAATKGRIAARGTVNR